MSKTGQNLMTHKPHKAQEQRGVLEQNLPRLKRPREGGRPGRAMGTRRDL